MKKILTDIMRFTDQLEQILKQEFETLEQQDFDQLMALTSQKQKLVEQLDALEKQRQQLSAGHESFKDYLQQQVEAKDLRKQWNIIRQKLQQCREQNEINGRLLQKKQQLSGEMLDLLSGKQNNAPATYEADGTQQKSGSILGDTQA